MNRSRAMIYLIWTSLLFNFGRIDAYELATHGQVTRRAFERSVGVRRYLEALSIKDTDIFDRGAATPAELLGGFFDNMGTVKQWMMEGSVREDDFTTAIPTCPQPQNPATPIDRPGNHFFDVQRGGGGLSAFPFSGLPAPDWALGQQGRSENQFTILDARQYQFKSLTESSKADREKNTALLFRALGQVIHLVQDMAQPQHTRNDPHAGCLFSIGGEHSWYEGYIEKRARGQTYRQRTPPPSLDSILAQDYTPPKFTTYREFWIKTGGAGLADFSSRNFFSAGTNLSVFGNCGGLFEPFCNDSVYPQTTETFSYQTITGGTVTGEVVLYNRSAEDRNSGELIPNVKVSSRSVWDQHLESRGLLFTEFTLNTLNYDSMSAVLLPRAVGYSAGLLDYFFRGRLKGVLQRVNGPFVNIGGEFIPVYVFTPPYTVEVKLTNESEQEAMEGNFRLYADKPDDTRSQLADLGQQTLAAGETRTFSFPVAEGFGDVKQVFVVFQGRLGQESQFFS